MFNKETYTQRRETLRKSVKEGIILILGNVDVPMNYRSNTYRFRQDSNFLYYFGLDQQGLAGILDADSGEEILFGDDLTLDDIIWMGPQPSIQERAAMSGIRSTLPFEKLAELLEKARADGRRIHFTPPYRAENKLLLEQLLGIRAGDQSSHASAELIKAIVAQRSIKEPQEVEEIERAMEVAWLMHTTAMKMAKPGVYEHEIAGVVEGIAISANGMLSFPLILSINGETLHNHAHDNKLEEGRLLLMDGGAETAMHYATDHTRTMPVGGRFSQKQKQIYEIVLDAQLKAIQSIKPGVPFKSIHLLAAETIADGLKATGLMKGDVKEAVEQGAHALFMPHGLGHMMGLDVHDMEDLGEDYVGYDDQVKRSDVFGTAFLRLGRKLRSGFVLTVEPGIYFIPALIEKWEQEGKFRDYINYDAVKSYLDFGGIRIEDDILVTDDGYRVLGRPIPKTVADIERIMIDGK
ncbi:MAG: aminopeptidase P family protein [Bacteroidia bacterium]|nr:MAG: aminopeptidase P family protein [Bacteroidia bacterium]